MQGPVESSGAPQASPPAERRRRLWAQSRDSMWQSTLKPEPDQDHDPDSGQHNGRVPHKISSWLSQCRTPHGSSLDEHSGSPHRGVRNGCSFEDDLSLGAEANHLQCSPSRSEPGFGLAADQKRSQFKERARSMNSTGSGKSSTVSSVSELLDLYEEDPEEILMNLGFGREEPDLASKVPSRFFNGSSCARGIDFKVFLGAQLQRLELENPNYALTSRFRQIEVLTTVANEFFQLYSQVSGQPVDRITPREPGPEGDSKDHPAVKRSSSALNAAKLLKKSISRHNLLAQANAQANVKANEHSNAPDSAPALASDPASPQPSSDAQAQAEESKTSKLKMDSAVLPSVSEESSEAEADRDAQAHSTEQILGPAANQSAEVVSEITNYGAGKTEQTSNGTTGEVELTANHTAGDPTMQPEEEATNLNAGGVEQTTNDSTGDVESTASGTVEEGIANEKVSEEEKEANEPAAGERAVNPQLALLRTENADSFDIEEIHSAEDDVPPQRSSRTADLSRTVSQQSDSSGFAEEPSSESSSFLKVQESSDSCDSETTVTSHPSQDLATPLALDQPAFCLLTGGEQSEQPQQDEPDQGSAIPQYTAHQLPKNRTLIQTRRHPSPPGEPEPRSEHGQSQQDTLEDTSSTSNIQPSAHFSSRSLGESLDVDRPRQAESPDFVSDCSESSLPVAPPSPVLGALHRAKLNQRIQGRGRGRSGVPLQRSSPLPTTVVSSVRIHLGRGKMSNGSSSQKHSRNETDGQGMVTPLRAIPRHLMTSRSVCSSPPPDWPVGGPSHSWSTRSVPDLLTNPQYQHPPGVTYPHALPHHYGPSASPYGHSASPYGHSASLYGHSASPYGHTHGLYGRSYTPYGSLPNLTPHHPVFPPSGHVPHDSPHMLGPGWLGGTYSSPQAMPPYSGLSHGTPTPSLSHYGSHSHLHHMTPPSLGSQPYLPEAPPPQPGFNLGSAPSSVYGGTMFSPDAALPPHLASSSEVQLRRVLQDIRGAVHRLGQSRFGSMDVLTERRAPSVSPQAMSELQQKRRSLKAFRSQMMELELSILREQAPVYRHLSPNDRLEVEQLQRLRSAVREELQELEAQLEERLLELHPSTQMGFQQDTSEDNLSSASAMRAMEPVSDLLREQLLLQSQLSYHSNSGSSASSCCSSPIRRPQSQGAGHYSASINITPAPPPRPGAETPQPYPSEEPGEELHHAQDVPNGTVRSQEPETTPPVDNLQQLMREIRESVAQEIRQEIYSELLASLTPSKQQ